MEILVTKKIPTDVSETVKDYFSELFNHNNSGLNNANTKIIDVPLNGTNKSYSDALLTSTREIDLVYKLNE